MLARRVACDQLVGPDLFNVTGNGSYDSGFPALRSYEHWIKLGAAAAFDLAAQVEIADPGTVAFEIFWFEGRSVTVRLKPDPTNARRYRVRLEPDPTNDCLTRSR
jgi:hypothetical protein